MAKDRKKLQHIHSSVPDKQPTPATLEVGEIAVNNSKDQEFLSIKNSEDRVVRFSSDEQLVTIMEKKEVMPYVGYVRGETGPSATSADTPTKDVYGSYGVTDNDLLNNTSNIIIKLNQVAAGNTIKHNRVNGAKDRYNKLVNPTTDNGITDGAGFFIDMSRYAMQGANPEFSGITNTCYTELNGRTEILGGTGTTGDCRSYLHIDTLTAETKISSAKTDVTTATTTIGKNDTVISGNTTLKVSGTTTNTYKGNVTVNNNANKSETTDGAYSGTTGGTTTEIKVGNVTESNSGTTTIDRKGDVSVNNQSNVTEVTSGNSTATVKGNVVSNTSGTTTYNNSGTTTTNVSANTFFNTIGTTTIKSTGSTLIETNGANNKVTIQSTGNGGDIEVFAEDTLCESGATAAFNGTTKTNIGLHCNDTGSATTTNIYGQTINKRANTADTRVTSAYTSATTATTIIGTAKTSATTADYSGDTLEINESTSISAKTPTTTLSGTSLTINETNTDVSSCGRISGKTDSFTIQECNAGSGKAVINQTDVDINGKTFDVVETTSATIKAPNTTISGTNFNVTETNTTINSCGKIEINTDKYILKQCNNSGGTADFEFCNGYTVKSNKITLSACSADNGEINIAEKTINISGGNNVNITANGAGGNVTIHANDTLCESAKTVSVFASDGGKLTIGGNSCAGNTGGTYPITYIRRPKAGTCEIHSTTIDDALDEVYDRSRISLTSTAHTTADRTYTAYTIHQDSGTCDASVNFTVNGTIVSMSAETYPASSELLKKYTFWQYLGNERKEIGVIDIPKDHILKDVSIVNGKLNGSSFTPCPTGDNTCSWFIKLVWNVFDPSTGHADDKVVYLPADDLVKDIDENNTNSDRGANVDVWYDGKKNQVSATTKVTIKNANGTGTKEFSRANGFHTLNSYTLKSVSGDVKTNNAATNWTYDPFDKQLTITAATDASHINRKTLSWRYGNVKDAVGGTYDPGDGTVNTMGSSRTMEFIIPTSIGDLSGAGSLSVTHNGFNGTFDVNNNQNWTLPHSALTATYEATSGKSGTVTYNTSAASSISIPTCVNHLNRHKITFSKGSVSTFTSQTYDPGKDCANTAETINIPTSIDELSNWNGTCISLPHNVCVDGTVTASGAVYSSDRRLKENIRELTDHDLDTVERIKLKKFNFISDKSKTTTYGVIAQELRNIGMANIVHTNDEGYYGVDYTSLFILEIASLKREIQRLKNRVSELEKDKNQ